jgi:hypothetical protein
VQQSLTWIAIATAMSYLISTIVHEELLLTIGLFAELLLTIEYEDLILEPLYIYNVLTGE